MNSRDGAGTATAKKKEEESWHATEYEADVWVPLRLFKEKKKDKEKEKDGKPRFLKAMAPTPSSTSTTAATRQGCMVTLSYTLHATAPMTFVTVTYTSGNNRITIDEWSADLHLHPSQDAFVPPTTADLTSRVQFPYQQATIEIWYSVAGYPNLLASSLTI
jgi:hypothetical protein